MNPKSPSERARATLGAAVETLRAGRAAAALELCVLGLSEAPQDAALNELAALAAGQAGRPGDAAGFARRSLAARPDHPGTLVALGSALRALGQFGEAAEAFERAMRLAPERPRAAFLLCATWLQAGDPRAAALVDGLLARFPADAAGWEEIGRVLQTLGKPQAALTCFSRAMQAAPGFALALRIGLLLKDLGRPGEAAAAFRQASALDPTSVRAWFLLGLSLQDSGDRAGAAAAYRAALARDPTLAEAAVNLGTVLQDDGDLDAAKAAYGQALALRADTFGRIAQAMTSARRGELWLDLNRLRRVLGG